MLRLVLLSMVLAVGQCKFCDSVTWLSCKCNDDSGSLLFTTSHHEVDTDEWITSIIGFGGLCNANSAEKLWNNITGKNKCRQQPSLPQRDERPSESEMIDRGYERHGTSLYKFHIETEDWESARRVCMAEGAHLAIVNADQEAQMLKNIFKRYPQVKNTYNNDHALIGFHDHFSEGNYITIIGEPLEVAGYDEWAPNSPDNWGRNYAGHPGQNCGAINREGKLVDVACWVRFAYFCELEDRDNPLSSEINYIAGYYTGVDSAKKPPPGMEKRDTPSSGYTYYSGIGFYKMHTKTETWENARRICESEEAHLAIINSEQEDAVLTVIFSKHKVIYDTFYNDFAFIGLHDQFTEGKFLTVFNDPLESTRFTRWYATYEPNNYGATNIEVGEDCGSVHRNGGLNDVPCHRKLPFICEQPLLV